MNWYVVRDKKIIVSGSQALSEEQARAFADVWNTLSADANYEAISTEEATKRYAKPCIWGIKLQNGDII